MLLSCRNYHEVKWSLGRSDKGDLTGALDWNMCLGESLEWLVIGIVSFNEIHFILDKQNYLEIIQWDKVNSLNLLGDEN